LNALGIRTLPSATNFVTAEFGSEQAARRIDEELAKRGVLVRFLTNYSMPRCVRISVGADDQIDHVLRILAEIIGSAHVA
jgi:histidinol-phosphate aminotransferase